MGDKKIDKVTLLENISGSNLNGDVKKHVINKLVNDDHPEEVEGMLDKFLGSRNTKIYLVAILFIVLLVAVGICCFIFQNNMTPFLNAMQVISPILSLALGYIVGEKAK